MASTFDALAAAASAVVADVFGELVRVEARRLSQDVNARRAFDVDRPTFETTAIFGAPAADSSLQGRGMTGTNVHNIVAPRPQMTFEGSLPWPIRKGDLISRIDPDTLALRAKYEVLEVHRHDFGQTRVELGPA